MKKRLYTLLTALHALMGAANAQSFDFVYQGRTLDEGAGEVIPTRHWETHSGCHQKCWWQPLVLQTGLKVVSVNSRRQKGK